MSSGAPVRRAGRIPHKGIKFIRISVAENVRSKLAAPAVCGLTAIVYDVSLRLFRDVIQLIFLFEIVAHRELSPLRSVAGTIDLGSKERWKIAIQLAVVVLDVCFLVLVNKN